MTLLLLPQNILDSSNSTSNDLKKNLIFIVTERKL